MCSWSACQGLHGSCVPGRVTLSSVPPPRPLPPSPTAPTAEHLAVSQRSMTLSPRSQIQQNKQNRDAFSGISQPKAPLRLKQLLRQRGGGPRLTLSPLFSSTAPLPDVHLTHLGSDSVPAGCAYPRLPAATFCPVLEGGVRARLSCNSVLIRAGPGPGEHTEDQKSLSLLQGPAHLNRNASSPDVLVDGRSWL